MSDWIRYDVYVAADREGDFLLAADDLESDGVIIERSWVDMGSD